MLLLAVVILNSVRDPWTSPQNACINNLRAIEASKQSWAIDNHRTNGPVSWSDIHPYLTKVQQEQRRKVEMPHCPDGGIYTLGDIGDLPKCSIKGHETVP